MGTGRSIFMRKKFITNRKVQVALATTFLVWFAAFLAIFVLIFFNTFNQFSTRSELLMTHDQLITKMLLVEQSKELALWYGISTFVYLALMWVYMLIYSHRLTGPISKITKILENAAKEEQWPADVKFRKGDAFTELASAFNHFANKMKSK